MIKNEKQYEYSQECAKKFAYSIDLVDADEEGKKNDPLRWEVHRSSLQSHFKFSDSLQLRMENLLEKKKADELTSEDVAELDAIGELDHIFTLVNAMIAAQDGNK